MQLLGNAQLVEHGLGAALGVPAVHLGKLALQLRRADAVLVGKVRLAVERFLLLHHLVEALVAHDDGAEHVKLVIKKMVLLEHGDALAGGDDYLAAVGLQLAREDFQKLALARAVGADDAIAVALVKLDIYVFIQNALAELQRHIACLNHVFSIPAFFS